MPKNQVNDLITDQEINFAHLILAGTMTDRDAAETAGLNPATAAYTKAKPRVIAYMLEHRAAMHQQRVQQETDEKRRLTMVREQVLTRLWTIANLSHEETRNSISAQIKALSLIINIEGLIPDRRAGASQKKPASPPALGEVYRSAWLPDRQGETSGPEPSPDLGRDEELSRVPPLGAASNALADPGSNTGPEILRGESTIALHVEPAGTTPSMPLTPASAAAPDTGTPFSIQKGRFGRRR